MQVQVLIVRQHHFGSMYLIVALSTKSLCVGLHTHVLTRKPSQLTVAGVHTAPQSVERGRVLIASEASVRIDDSTLSDDLLCVAVELVGSIEKGQ